jgi:PmbA protein
MNLIKFALKNGADDVIIEKNSTDAKQVRFANNTLQIFNNWNIITNEIFLSYKKRTVNTIVFDDSEDSLKKAILNLIKSAKVTQPNHEYYGVAKGPFKYKKIPKIFDKKVINANLPDITEEMINAALEYSKNTAGIVYTESNERELETSSNVSASEKTTSIKLSIRAFNKEDETGHAASCSKMLNGIDPEKIGKKAGEISKLSKNPEKMEQGKYDVIFDPLSMANMLSAVGAQASAFFVDSGISFLRGKINKRVASNLVTLIDDGTMANGCYSTSFDEEGVSTQKTTIVDKGILKTYLHNTSTAKKYKTKTTASAGIVVPGPKNIVLKPGNVSKEKLFGDFTGLYITNVWYTRFQNYLNGDFSTIPRDGIFLYKNGEIVKSAKEIRVSDNLQGILESIVNISNRPEWILWWGLDYQVPIFTPYVLVKGVNITRSTM